MSQSTFDNYGLPPKLLQALSRNKFTTPTPIQEQTIPLALEGKDILGSAQTGTGKTGAFGIPTIAGLMNRPDAAALIMTPTRELAGQVMKALEPMIPTIDIRTALLIGGEAMPRQFHQLRHNPRLIVGTPGRINDHLERGTLKLDNVRFLVLDETDRMLDMGFGIQIERILKHIPDDRQTLLFSATLPSNITKLSGKYMRDPVRIAVGATSTPVAKIKQEVIPTTDAEKFGILLEQLEARKGSVIIFVKTKYNTEKLADKLNKNDHKADAIHGDLQQRRRERVIQNFRDKKYRILVATDVAARGLDIPHIAHVINYDMPQAPEDYIHRIGRTARAGAEGEAVSFLSGADHMKWRAIQRLLGGEDPNTPQPRGGGNRGGRRGFGGGRKPFWKRDGERPAGDKARGSKPYSDKPKRERSYNDGPKRDSFGDKPKGQRSESHGKKTYDGHRADKAKSERTYGEKSHDRKPYGEQSFKGKPRGDKRHGDQPRSDRPYSDKPRSDKPRSDRPYSDKPRSDKPRGEGTFKGHQNSDRPFGGKSRGGKPFAGKSFGGKPRSGGSKSHRGRS